jgi:hypothetical protein
MYDPECETLAEHFLSDEPQKLGPAFEHYEARVKQLAQAIQDAVESWCEDNPREEG